MSEKRFENDTIKHLLRKNGLTVTNTQHIGNGHPDMIISKGWRFLYLENKEKIASVGTPIKSHFTKYQAPWYLQNDVKNAFCLYRYYTEVKRYFTIFRITNDFATNLKNIRFHEIRYHTDSCLITTVFSDIVDYIGSWLDEK